MVGIDRRRIEQAIRRAERRTSGEIRVSLARPFWGDVREVAEKAFERLGMRATRERNAVLLFIVPSRHRFVVLGDRGIHQKVGQQFWRHLAGLLSDRLRHGDLTDGIVAGIEVVGEVLAQHFPRREGSASNELPDEVDFHPGS